MKADWDVNGKNNSNSVKVVMDLSPFLGWYTTLMVWILADPSQQLTLTDDPKRRNYTDTTVSLLLDSFTTTWNFAHPENNFTVKDAQTFSTPKQTLRDGLINNTYFTTNFSTASTSYDPNYQNPLYVASQMLYKYGMTVIFAFGIVGNSLVIATILTGQTGHSSSSLYLLGLAVLDQYNILAAVLGSHMIRSFTPNRFDYIRAHPWACRVAYFSIVTCAQSSFWLVAIMSAERAIVLSNPLYFRDKFNKRTTRIAIVSCVVFWALKNLHFFWSYGAVYKNVNGTMVKSSECGILPGPMFDFNVRVRPWIDYVATFGAATVIVVCNIIIVVALVRSDKLKREATMKKTDDGRGSGTHRHLMAMLITVSVSFILLALPLQIITILVPRNPNDVRSDAAALADLLWSIGLLTNYGNNAVNFYLYCLSGRMFRRDLARLFRCASREDDVATKALPSTSNSVVKSSPRHSTAPSGSFSIKSQRSAMYSVSGNMSNSRVYGHTNGVANGAPLIEKYTVITRM